MLGRLPARQRQRRRVPMLLVQCGIAQTGSVLDFHFKATAVTESANGRRWDHDSERIHFA